MMARINFPDKFVDGGGIKTADLLVAELMTTRPLRAPLLCTTYKEVTGISEGDDVSILGQT